MDDLLDEAMDDTVATETESETGVPVAPPRRSIKRENSRQNRPVSYHGSTSSKVYLILNKYHGLIPSNTYPF